LGLIQDDLCRDADELRETHASWVFLHAACVYKVKKPVDFGFLDFRTLAQRKAACEVELTLNARLAPNVYLSVARVTCDAHGVHAIHGEGDVVDYAVEMVRLRDEDAADRRLASGRLTRAHVTAIGERIAQFHREARSDADTARFGKLEVIRGNAIENFEQTHETAGEHLAQSEVDEIARQQLRFLDKNAALFNERVQQGFIRDGHGDLRLEHVYISDAGHIDIIDCIEFNERFRYADTCSDIAFLSMDLVSLGQPMLSEVLLAAYARASHDYGLYRLVDFYESYRAYVRAKVASFVEVSAGLPEPARAKAHATARKHYLLALACVCEPMVPPFVCAVGGYIATGKSTAADRLADMLGVPVVDADRTRKHLAQAAPMTPLREGAFQGAYSVEASRAVYAEVFARAEAVLRSGRGVIIDASFRAWADRAEVAALAQREHVPFVFVECRAPLEVLHERLKARGLAPHVSDGRPEILDAFIAGYEPVTEFLGSQHVVIDTTCATPDTWHHVAMLCGRGTAD
jgi:uncharacterized protein